MQNDKVAGVVVRLEGECHLFLWDEENDRIINNEASIPIEDDESIYKNLARNQIAFVWVRLIKLADKIETWSDIRYDLKDRFVMTLQNANGDDGVTTAMKEGEFEGLVRNAMHECK